MVVFINSSTVFGVLISSFTYYISGSLFLTLLSVFLFLFAIAFAFRMPIEYTIIAVLPLLLAVMAYTNDFQSVGMAFAVYMAALLVKGLVFGW